MGSPHRRPSGATPRSPSIRRVHRLPAARGLGETFGGAGRESALSAAGSGQKGRRRRSAQLPQSRDTERAQSDRGSVTMPRTISATAPVAQEHVSGYRGRLRGRHPSSSELGNCGTRAGCRSSAVVFLLHRTSAGSPSSCAFPGGCDLVGGSPPSYRRRSRSRLQSRAVIEGWRPRLELPHQFLLRTVAGVAPAEDPRSRLSRTSRTTSAGLPTRGAVGLLPLHPNVWYGPCMPATAR